ncbi:MAG: glycosyltransferase [Butyrivibrio sp.]|nr:glycosyltransferase [Butyrivibrio sp.]
MKFSVIIPVYNGVEYLDRAMESVLGQTHDGSLDVEVILIENGSTDDSAKRCDDYAATYHMVTAFHRGKIGAYAARRLGMEVASGEWLLFLDADDELKTGAVAELDSFLGSCEKDKFPDIIFYNYERLSASGVSLRTFPFVPGRLYEKADKKVFYDTMCQGDLLNPLWNKCVRKELAAASLAEDENIFLNHGEDLLQTAQFLDRAERISYLEKTIYRYRCDNQGLTGKYHEEFLPNQKYAWEKLEAYAKKWEDKPMEYSDMIAERKALTTCIAAKTIVMSDMRRKEISEKLKELFADAFYREYYGRNLPKWASEEDIFYHSIQTCSYPYKMFMRNVLKCRVKAFIKARIRK